MAKAEKQFPSHIKTTGEGKGIVALRKLALRETTFNRPWVREWGRERERSKQKKEGTLPYTNPILESRCWSGLICPKDEKKGKPVVTAEGVGGGASFRESEVVSEREKSAKMLGKILKIRNRRPAHQTSDEKAKCRITYRQGGKKKKQGGPTERNLKVGLRDHRRKGDLLSSR